MPDNQMPSETLSPVVATESASTSASAIPTDASPSDASNSGSDDGTLFQRKNAWSDFSKIDAPEPDAADAETKSADAPPAPESGKTTDETANPNADDDDAILEEVFSDDELDRENPDEVVKAQGSRRKMAAARRNQELADVVRTFQSADKPIADVLSGFEKLSPPRYEELTQTLAHQRIDSNPDAVFHRAYLIKQLANNPNFDAANAVVPSLDDIIKGNYAGNGASGAEKQTDLSELAAAADDLSNTFDFDWRDSANDEMFTPEELQLVSIVRKLEKQIGERNPSAEQTAELESLKAQVKTADEKNAQEAKVSFDNTFKESVSDFRAAIEKPMVPYITKAYGLQISETDSPLIKSVKENLLAKFIGTPQMREQDRESAFEVFAYNDSSQAQVLGELVDELIPLQKESTAARLSGNTAESERLKPLIAELQIPIAEAFKKAITEFGETEVKPFIDLIESLSGDLVTKNAYGSQRVEITGNGGQPPAQTQTVSDPEPSGFAKPNRWEVMAKEYERDQRLRASG